MNNNTPYWETKARELDKAGNTDKARWYRIRRPTAPGSTPYGMARPIKDIQLDQGDPLALNEARSGQATAPNPYGKFGSALMDLLKRHQVLGTRSYQEGALSLEEQQADRVMKQAEPGMPPSLQSQIRGAEAGALQPSISGVRERGRTFAEQLRGFSGALAQSQQIGEFMANQERQTELTKKQDEKEARDIIFQFPGAVAKLPEEQKRALEKQAGVQKGLIDLLSVEVEAETKTLGKSLFEKDPTTGKWKMVARAPAELDTGVSGIEGEIDYEELSPLAKAVVDGTATLKDLTPTDRAGILPELNSYGYTQRVSAEMKQDVGLIVSQMDEIMTKWLKVPDRYKGQLQGRTSELTRAEERVPEIAEFYAASKIIGMQLTRLYEKGRISDQDRIFYLSLMPNIRQNKESAQDSADELKRILNLKIIDVIRDESEGEINKDPLNLFE